MLAGRFHRSVTEAFQNSQYFRSLSVADVNGDGKPDIVITDEFFDEVRVLLLQ
jgi:FG-GAP repeat